MLRMYHDIFDLGFWGATEAGGRAEAEDPLSSRYKAD